MTERKRSRGRKIRLSTGAWWQLCVYTLALLAGLWSTGAQAQFCGDVYRMADDPTGLYVVDTSTNPWIFNLQGTAGVCYNAMAYRVANNTLLAIQCGTNTLLQINIDGSADPLGAVSGLPTATYHAGEFAPDGFMYVRNTVDGNNLYRIDVDALSATAVPLSQGVSFADIAWLDGLFYGVGGPGGSNDLVSVDTSGGVTVIGPTGTPGGFGGMYSASNGVFGLSNFGGAYQFDITTGAGTFLSDSPTTGNHDGARCFEAPLQLEADLSVTKDDGSDTYTPGTDVVYDIVVVNSGPMGVQNAEVNDPLPDGITTASWTCAGADGGVCGADSGSGAIFDSPDLPPDASVTYTLTLSVPSDFTGDLVNTVAVDLPEGFIDPTPDNNTAMDVNTSTVDPSISLEKSGSGPDPLTVDSTVEYSFLVTNTGNVTLSDVTVTDPLPGMSPIACPNDTLDAGAEMTCTATYTVTQEDADAGFIENTATVTGQSPQGTSVDDESSTVVPPSQVPGISIDKSASGPDPLAVGATIEYSFLVTNTGNVTLSDVTVTDPLPGLSPISCPSDTLAPGAEMTCTATYTVTQADVDAGVIENTGTVTGQPPGGLPPPTDESSTTFPPTGTPGISIEKSGSGPDPLTVGATIDYSFEVENTGNVTLTNVTITDPLPGLSPIDCPTSTLAPGAAMTCTATYTVTQADVDAGMVENTATVTGETPTGQPPPSDESTTTVPPTPPVPALPLLAGLLLALLLSLTAMRRLRRSRA